MLRLRSIVAGLRALFRKQQVEREMDEELRGYLDAAVKEKMRSGMSHEQALRAARVEMGSLEAVKEEIRGAGWESKIETFWKDLRYGLRMLRKNPGFAAVAVLTLALGIGVNTIIFSVVDGFFLRPLPAKDPHQLVWVYAMRQGKLIQASYPDYLDLRQQDAAFSGIIALSRHVALLNTAGETELVKADLVSENYFSVLGINATLGRTFVTGENWESHKDPPWSSATASGYAALGLTPAWWGGRLSSTGDRRSSWVLPLSRSGDFSGGWLRRSGSP